MRKYDVSIVIPNWNGKKLLEKNLPKVLAAQENPENNIREVIVIDDYSTDESLTFLKKEYRKKIRIVRHTKNRGFASAVNTGFRYAKSDLVCLLNSDVTPTPAFLKNTFDHFMRSDTFAVGLHEKGYGPSSGSFDKGYLKHRAAPESNEKKFSLWASGGSALFRRELWWKVGGFDNILFAPFYWEDVDIGYRAWKRGYKILWEPTAIVEHKHESVINPTNFQKKYMDMVKERNELLFIWKNITSNSLIRKHINAVVKRCLKHPGYIKVVMFALKKRKTLHTRRQTEMKESRVSDEAVFSHFI